MKLTGAALPAIAKAVASKDLVKNGGNGDCAA